MKLDFRQEYFELDYLQRIIIAQMIRFVDIRFSVEHRNKFYMKYLFWRESDPNTLDSVSKNGNIIIDDEV